MPVRVPTTTNLSALLEEYKATEKLHDTSSSDDSSSCTCSLSSDEENNDPDECSDIGLDVEGTSDHRQQPLVRQNESSDCRVKRIKMNVPSPFETV